MSRGATAPAHHCSVQTQKSITINSTSPVGQQLVRPRHVVHGLICSPRLCHIAVHHQRIVPLGGHPPLLDGAKLGQQVINLMQKWGRWSALQVKGALWAVQMLGTRQGLVNQYETTLAPAAPHSTSNNPLLRLLKRAQFLVMKPGCRLLRWSALRSQPMSCTPTQPHLGQAKGALKAVDGQRSGRTLRD